MKNLKILLLLAAFTGAFHALQASDAASSMERSPSDEAEVARYAEQIPQPLGNPDGETFAQYLKRVRGEWAAFERVYWKLKNSMTLSGVPRRDQTQFCDAHEHLMSNFLNWGDDGGGIWSALVEESLTLLRAYPPREGLLGSWSCDLRAAGAPENLNSYPAIKARALLLNCILEEIFSDLQALLVA